MSWRDKWSRRFGGRALATTLRLENAKFALLLVLPAATAYVFTHDDAVDALVQSRQYIVYPAETSAHAIPQTELELRKAADELKHEYKQKRKRAAPNRDKPAADT